MLPKSLRLSKNRVLSVIRYGRKAASDEATLYLLKNQTLQGTRWHVQIPKKLVPKASGRNRIRRVFHEAIRTSSRQDLNGEAVLKITKAIQNPSFIRAQEVLKRLFL